MGMHEDRREEKLEQESKPAAKAVTPEAEVGEVTPDGMIAAFAVKPEVKPEA